MLRAAGLIVFIAANCASATSFFELQCVTKFFSKDNSEILVHSSDPASDSLILRALNAENVPYKIVNRATDCVPNVARPDNYMIISNYVDNKLSVERGLNDLAAKACTWSPSSRMIMILSDTSARSAKEYENVATQLIGRMWNKSVYDVVVVFHSKTDAGQRSLPTFSANPFDEKNKCGVQVSRLIQLDPCHVGIQETEGASIWTRPDVYPNCTLKVSRRVSPPFSFVSPNGWSGVDVRFVRMLRRRKHLNVVWSERLSSEEGSPMSVVHQYYQEIAEKTTDIAIGGVILQSDYYNKVSYLKSYAQTMLRYYVARADILRGYDTIHIMFTKDVWLLLCASIILGGPCYNMLKESTFFAKDSKLILLLAILSNQPIKMPQRWRLRLYVAVFLLPLYQFSTLYSTSIQSFMIRNPRGKDILTLDDLKETKMPVYVSETNFHLIDEAKTNFQNLKTSYRALPELLEALHAQRNFSVLERHYGVDFWKQLRHYSITALKEGETVMSVSMALRRGSLYYSTIDELVQKSLEGGLFLKWLNDLTIIRKNSTHLAASKVTTLEPLSTIDLECAWFILAAGHTLAFSSFCIEILLAKLRYRKLKLKKGRI